MEARLTAIEAAGQAKKHYKTIASALRGGSLHGTQISGKGGAWLIRESCLDAWVDGSPCAHQSLGRNPKKKVPALTGTKDTE